MMLSFVSTLINTDDDDSSIGEYCRDKAADKLVSIFVHQFVLSLDSVFAGQHVIEPVHLYWREDEVHQLANTHQRDQLQQAYTPQLLTSTGLKPRSHRIRHRNATQPTTPHGTVRCLAYGKRVLMRSPC